MTDPTPGVTRAFALSAPSTVIAGIDPAHLIGPAQAAADAIAGRLDLERWERDGWPTIDRDLGAVAAPAVLRWMAFYLAAADHHTAANDVTGLAGKLDPTGPGSVPAVQQIVGGLVRDRDSLRAALAKAERERDSLARRLGVRVGELEEACAACRQAADERDAARAQAAQG
ncbi:hypothetical protein [Micromonospora carbonacea]|uniref:hypothetical protein n=1 Tax=Micromonospora carbonacea TaxID=47853 RepID=UPI0037223150